MSSLHTLQTMFANPQPVMQTERSVYMMDADLDAIKFQEDGYVMELVVAEDGQTVLAHVDKCMASSSDQNLGWFEVEDQGMSYALKPFEAPAHGRMTTDAGKKEHAGAPGRMDSTLTGALNELSLVAMDRNLGPEADGPQQDLGI